MEKDKSSAAKKNTPLNLRLAALRAAREGTAQREPAGENQSNPLWEKLKERERKLQRAGENRRLSPKEFPLPGWEKAGPYLYVKTTEEKTPPEWTGSRLAGVFFPGEKVPPKNQDLLFYDLETTGLSGGAGTLAFLAGCGVLEEDRLKITQVFLSDYPGEAEFLEYLAFLMPREKTWVSYNGKAFDNKLLQSRYLMNRMSFLSAKQLDLLYPSRRLWKSILPDCSLTSLERFILKKDRVNDIPGAYVPQRYFTYLQNKDPDPLLPVFSHHEEDIRSLAALFFFIPRILEEKDPAPHDELGAAFLLMRHPDFLPLGEKRLKKVFDRGHAEAGRFLGLFYKRRRQWQNAENTWGRLWEEHRDAFAGVELAKHLEHRKGDFSSALSLVSQMQKLDKEKLALCRDDLEKREDRLRRKLAP